MRTFVSRIIYKSNLHNQCIKRESSFFLVTITSFSASLYSNRNGAIFSRSPRTFSRSVFSDVIVKYTSQADWSSILKSTSYQRFSTLITSASGAYFLNSYYSAYLINYPTIEQIKDIFPTFLISLVTAFLIWSLTLLNLSEFLLLPLQIIAGIIIAFVIYEKTRLSEYIELKQLALSLLCRKK